jgi:two-component system sensor histidine kinase CpxA
MLDSRKSRGSQPSGQRLACIPLGLQILCWFFLNLLLVCLIGSAIFISRFKSGLEMLMDAKAIEKVDAIRIKVFRGLNFQPSSTWNETLGLIAKKHRIELAVFSSQGAWVAGEIRHPPQAVMDEILRLPIPWSVTPPQDAARQAIKSASFLEKLKSSPSFSGSPTPFIKSADSSYWIGVRLAPISATYAEERDPMCMLMASDSIRFGGLLMEVMPLGISIFVLLGSALFWLPLVRRITRPIRAMERAATAIAGGNFNTRVPVEGNNELGRLALSINTLASQFKERLESRRRFVGDVAHELGSPLVRMQWALDVLEKQIPEIHQEGVNNLREEVNQMVSLLQELLNFNKSISSTRYPHEPLCIATLLYEAAKQEDIPTHMLETTHLTPMTIEANSHLLKRAISNVLRNCIRYAPYSGPILIATEKSAAHATLHVTDGGPGVPPEMIPRLGEPFFRTDAHRSRQTGGTGLGLSIVKRCVEACNGTLQITNATPTGLRVSITLKLAEVPQG